jgi:hypothetical protein
MVITDLNDLKVQVALTELDLHLGSDAIGSKTGLSVVGDEDHGYTFRVPGDPGIYFVRLSGGQAVRAMSTPDGNIEVTTWSFGKRSKAERAPDWPPPGVQSGASG